MTQAQAGHFSRSPLGGRGLRFHRAAAPEEQDTLQHWGASRELQASVFTLIGWDPVTKRSVSASLPTVQTPGGPHAPVLEAYDWVGVEAFTSGLDAQARTEQISQTLEARNQTFDARSTVRSLRPGRWFELTGSTFDQLLNYSTTGDWLGYAGVVATLFWYRRAGATDAAPFRAPLYPVLPLVFLAAVLWVVAVTVWQHPGDAGMGALITLAGLPVYFVWRRLLDR